MGGRASTSTAGRELMPPELMPPELMPPELMPPELMPPELMPPELMPPELMPPGLAQVTARSGRCPDSPHPYERDDPSTGTTVTTAATTGTGPATIGGINPP